MKYAIVTFGCRVNQADSLHLEEQFLARGASEAPVARADVVVVNTCSVTATADQGARQTIRRIARDNPSARVLVTGCYATREPAAFEGLSNVLQVIPNDEKLDLLDRLEVTTAVRFGGGDGACGAPVVPGIAGRTAFTLRVQTGCEEHCSYCIIPSTRGRGRSMPPARAVREVRRIAEAGFKEIALTGVHLGSYGRDLQPSSSLETLFRALGDLDEDITFRISSLEPMDCTPAIVDLVASSGGRFAPHFHLPLQHASNRMLARMRRPYSLEAYQNLLQSIVVRLPHAAIGSDLIVGFPGEGEEAFKANLDYLPSSPLTHLHVFPYSDRPGTEASMLGSKVHGAVIRARGARMRAIGASLARRFLDAQIGTVRPALTLEDGTLAVTDNYLKVRIAAGPGRNERVRVRVLGDGRGRIEGDWSESSNSPRS
jgi:threonylcarbamoyladenosine tRNA methylthiotransferase MtaB